MLSLPPHPTRRVARRRVYIMVRNCIDRLLLIITTKVNKNHDIAKKRTLKDFAERNQCHQFHLLTRRNPSHRMCHPMERTFLYLHKERAPLRMLFLELSKWDITS
jgi:hypothetical protein